MLQVVSVLVHVPVLGHSGHALVKQKFGGQDRFFGERGVFADDSQALAPREIAQQVS